MKTKILLFALVLALVLIVGCSEQSNIISSSQGILQTVYIEPTIVTLFAGQTIDVGDVCVDVINNELCVTYTTTDGWELTEAHLWVGEIKSHMPSTRKGNPQVGHFPHHSGDITGTTTHTFYIPIADLGGEPYVCNKTFHIAAHAALRKDLGSGNYQIETGWGDGERMVERGNWATTFSIILLCSGVPPNHVTTDDAFGYDENYATCFLDPIIDGFDNWGWTNGPLATGSYLLNIYAGAGGCVLLNGTLVGTLTINYDGSTATVTYNMDVAFLLIETNLYVGNDILPINTLGLQTIWPKDYPYHHTDLYGSTSDTYTITGLTGDIYVVAHAVVCGTI